MKKLIGLMVILLGFVGPLHAEDENIDEQDDVQNVWEEDSLGLNQDLTLALMSEIDNLYEES